MDYLGSFGQAPKEALSKLEPVLRIALQPHENGDYEAYTEIITEELKRKLPKENFLKAYEKIAPQVNHLQSLRFLGSLDKDSNPLLLYSAKYSGTADDILVNVTFKKRNRTA